MLTLTQLPLYIFVFIGLYFQIFMLLTFLEKEAPKKDEEKDFDFPTVSITIPCFNEEKTVTATILSLLDLNYPKEKLSILVVDDGSTDSTASIVQTLCKTYPQIRLVHQKNAGKFTALNFGLKESTSQIVGGLDADSFVDRQALIRMIPHFSDPKVMAVTPAICVHKPKTLLQMVQRAEYNLGVFGKYIMGKMGAIHVTPGPFSLFRREVFDIIGPYRHAHNTEDMEIAFRMQEKGLCITNCPDAFVYTVTPGTIKKLHTQRVRWITGFLKNSLDYKHLFLNKKYGNMGVFTLPFSLLSVFAAIYFFGSMMYQCGTYLLEKFTKIHTVGFDFTISSVKLNWFFINTESIAILGALLLALAFFLTLLGKKMAEGSMKPSRDIIYFMVVYMFISPLWLSKAVLNTALSRKAPWR